VLREALRIARGKPEAAESSMAADRTATRSV